MQRFTQSMNENDLTDVKALIEELGIVCPVSGTKNWTNVRQFNRCSKHKWVLLPMGVVYTSGQETSGIFVNFLNVRKQPE